jgi:hypothetical protein
MDYGDGHHGYEEIDTDRLTGNGGGCSVGDTDGDGALGYKMSGKDAVTASGSGRDTGFADAYRG